MENRNKTKRGVVLTVTSLVLVLLSESGWSVEEREEALQASRQGWE